MAGTTSDKLALLRQIKESFRTAITGKGQTISDDEPFSSWPAKVEAIETGVQLPTLTNPGAAGDLRSGKQLIGHDGSTVNGSLSEVTQATPGISVSSSGLITASATQSGGIVTAGTKSATKQLSSSDDADFIAENIKKGYSIFGVTGTLEYIEPATVTVTNNHNYINDMFVSWINNDGTTGEARIAYGKSVSFETKKVFVISDTDTGTLWSADGCEVISVMNRTSGYKSYAITPTFPIVSFTLT